MDTSIHSKYPTRAFIMFSANSGVPAIWLRGIIIIKCSQIFPLRSKVVQIANCSIKVISFVSSLKKAKCKLFRDATEGPLSSRP